MFGHSSDQGRVYCGRLPEGSDEGFRTRLHSFRAAVVLTLLLFSASASVAADEAPCAVPGGIVTSVQGTVEVRAGAGGDWRPAALDQRLCAGDEVRTGKYGRAQIRLYQTGAPQSGRDGTVLQLDAQSALMLPSAAQPWWVELLDGAAHILSRTPRDFTIKTRYANARIEGTEFLVVADDQRTEVSVYEGKVRVSNASGDVRIERGETAVADGNGPPRREIRLRPRDAVRWSLYYPPIIDGRMAGSEPSLQSAWQHYREGRVAAAIDALDRLPEGEQGSNFHTLRAALLLSLGQVDLARADIEAAARLHRNDATAAALSAIVALAQNDKSNARVLSEQSVAAQPDASIGYVARSYASQASFDLDGALADARHATALDDGNALAWSRVAELELSTGDLNRAEASAARAVELDPRLARTHTVSGFASLGRTDTRAARQAFERAIALDPADPLPRLGLGLAEIREGHLVDGRQHMEDAANLDPDDALVRSYLGKAYYEERRDEFAATELDNAKALDPLDPTPWFYDAIRKQTQNRPIDALHDLKKAIALNDNRGVYRSSLALDSDRAARGAAQGRVYRDLGFERLGFISGWRSLSSDPTDYAAHRLLADTYRTTLRNDIGRVSELLQAQLFQPLNLLPVQPDAIDEGTLSGDPLLDASPVLTDFNSLFERNGLGLNFAIAGGNHTRFRDQLIHTGLFKNFSYSLGQSHAETNGFRDNNDLRLDAYDAFAQMQFSPAFSVQAEYRRRESEAGNLGQFVDTSLLDFFREYRTQTRLDSVRFGARLSPSVRSSLIASGVAFDGDSLNTLPDFRSNSDVGGYSAEGRYDYRGRLLQVVAGAGHYRISTTEGSNFCDPFPCGSFSERHDNGFLYATAHWPVAFAWTLGVADTHYASRDLQLKAVRWSPKLGLIWSITPRTDLRFAYIETVRRSLFANQTVEPTLVAGFDQFFDDPTATEALRRGVALDHEFNDDLHGGVELSSRLLRVPTAGISDISKWKEVSTVAYMTWSPTTSIAANVEFRREYFRNTDLFGPSSTDTRLLPLTIAYFNPGGFFAKLRGQFITQEVEPSGVDPSSDEGFFLDMSVGYRLGRQRGIFELLFENMLDTDMRFEGDSNRGRTDALSIPRALPFSPDFGVLATLQLAF